MQTKSHGGAGRNQGRKAQNPGAVRISGFFVPSLKVKQRLLSICKQRGITQADFFAKCIEEAK